MSSPLELGFALAGAAWTGLLAAWFVAFLMCELVRAGRRVRARFTRGRYTREAFAAAVRRQEAEHREREEAAQRAAEAIVARDNRAWAVVLAFPHDPPGERS